jgi:hypothetical protein
MPRKPNPPTGVPAPEDLRGLVRALVERVGEPLAVERLGLSRIALARLLAGLPIRRGTIALAREGLAKTVN